MKYHLTYSMLDVMMSSPERPMKNERRIHQLTRMWEGLAALEKHPEPTKEDWIVVTDGVNMMATLVKMGFAKDEDQIIKNCVEVMRKARDSYKEGKPMRLTGEGIQLIRGLLEDYADIIEQIDERTMVHCHRKTEMRVQDKMRGRATPEEARLTI
jgi:uncharacterized protein YyaL (SSP411 family)